MRRTFIIGNRHWGRHLSAVLAEGGVPAKYIDRSPRHLWRIFSDIDATVLMVGLGGPPIWQRLAIWAVVLAWWARRRRRGSIIVYWIGTDVLFSSRAQRQQAMNRMIGITGAKHICGAPWFASMLASFGVDAKLVWFPYDTTPAEAYPQPDLPPRPYRICTYLSAANWENSHGSDIMRLAELSPEIEWTVFGMEAKNAPVTPPGNVGFLGWVNDPLAVTAEHHALIRWIDHDAYSGVVRDAQAMGKAVLYTMPVAGTLSIAGLSHQQIVDAIRTLAEGERPSDDSGAPLPPYREQIAKLISVVRSAG